MKYTHIVFDVDGTLIDTAQSELQALRQALCEVMGQAKPDCELNTVFGTTGRMGLQILGYTPEEIDRIYPRWYELSVATIGQSPVFPGIPALLETLDRRGLALGVVTSRSYEAYLLGAKPHGMEPYFKTVVCRDDTERHKPEPEPLLAYLGRAGAQAGRTLYVGDSAFDVACAKAAGVDSALAGWGTQDKGLPATYYLEKPADLCAFL
ncbi:HAD family hydrolase [Intestinibacillus massiliensis]|uniref:HAD family hydrolase n=1 Tax=Intestinibacillus massiliensis TaxID=1871029 RepID=UPI000B3542DF|nr:HAD family hydrolase [Intestinibacillus massiliensis]